MQCWITLLSFLLFIFTAAQVGAAQPTTADERVAVVGRLALRHAGKLTIEDREFVVHEIKSHQYTSTDLDEIAERVRFALQRRGYFDVVVNDPVFAIVGRDESREIVDVSLNVDEGEIYHLKDIQFTHTSVFTSAELRREFPIGDGDLLDRQKIGHGLEELRRLYGRKGFANFTAVPVTQIDETAHTVSLVIDLDPGSVFRLGKLTVRGEESQPGAREKLLSVWKSYEGKVYDYTLLRQFLRDLHALPSVQPDQIFEIFQDEPVGIINVQITLVKPYTLLSSSGRGTRR